VAQRHPEVSEKKTFTYEDAAALLPRVQELTAEAYAAVESLPEEAVEQYQQIVADWAEALLSLDIEVKGLWLIDFDNGSGYYCWKYPEASLQFFHGYEEGFGGRVPLA
jgi:hypothetical protein